MNARSRKNLPKDGDDFDGLMETTTEDLEILQMTERTLVVPDDDDEEMIHLNGDGKGRKKVADGDIDAPADTSVAKDKDSDDYVFEISDAAKSSSSAPAKKASVDDDPQALSQSEMYEYDLDVTPTEKDAPGEKTGESKKPGLKKSHTIVLFLLLLALALLVGGGLFFSQEQLKAPGVTSTGKATELVTVKPQPQAPPAPVVPQQTLYQAAPAPVVPQQPATTPAISAVGDKTYTLRDVRFQKAGNNFQMKILADRPIKDYKSFSLSDPARQVIDLFGDWNELQFLEKKVNSGGISKIRLGEHADKLRIVVDFSRNQTVSPVFTSSPHGLIMTISAR